jgi:hypothetical protein
LREVADAASRGGGAKRLTYFEEPPKLRPVKPWTICGLVGMSLAVGSNALAGAPEEAEALISQGIALREQGKDDQALDLFRKAEAKAKTPRSTAQIALAEQALGMWVLAEAHLSAALEAKNDTWVEKHRGVLEGALATIQKHVGALEVRVNVAQAEVFVDGALVGTLPRSTPIRVETGPRQVEVRAVGYYPVSRAVSVSVEGMARETFSLAKLPPDAPKDPGGPVADKGSTVSLIAEPTNIPRTAGWVLVGTGAAAAAFGGVSFLVRELQTGRYNDRLDCPGVNKPNQPAVCQEILDAETTWRTVGLASFIGAGVLGVAGLSLVLFSPSTKPSTTKVSASCVPTVGTLGWSCGGTF